MNVKICGLKRIGDVELCGRLGVSIAGFVTEYPAPVPWNLTKEEAAVLLKSVRPPLKSCIVTGGSRKKIWELALDLRPHYVQLHFHETLADTAWLVKGLRPLGIQIIKTLPLEAEERKKQFGTADISQCMKQLNESGVDAVLYDARSPSDAAAQSQLPELTAFRQIQALAKVPVILAGGITADKMDKIRAAARPDMVDVMMGVEKSPGIKDERKLRELLRVCGRGRQTAGQYPDPKAKKR